MKEVIFFVVVGLVVFGVWKFLQVPDSISTDIQTAKCFSQYPDYEKNETQKALFEKCIK